MLTSAVGAVGAATAASELVDDLPPVGNLLHDGVQPVLRGGRAGLA